MKSTDPDNIYNNPHYLEPLDLGGVDLRPIDLLEHILATGGTGSGKTRSFLLPLVERVLRRFGTDDRNKAAMFLMDAKGDMAALAAECARRAGREEDVFILGEGGNCWFPFFEQFSGDTTRVANALFEILESRSSQGGSNRAGSSNDSFWDENARRLLRAAATLAKAAHGTSLGGLSGIAHAVNRIIAIKHNDSGDDDAWEASSDETAISLCLMPTKSGLEMGWLTEPEILELERYLREDVLRGNPRTWATIANMTRNYIAQFSQPELRKLFEPQPGKTRIRPEDIIDKGRLLIVSLSPVIYGEASAPFRLAVKKAFCERVLQRPHLCLLEEGEPRFINQHRPVLYVCDEFHTTLSTGSSGEAFFLDRAREFRCMCVLATQGISAIQSVLGDPSLCSHLLNNCRTKFFFANDCPQTSRYFEEMGGLEDREVCRVNSEPRPAPPRFRLPNHTYAPVALTRITGSMTDMQRLPRFCASKLGKLPNGRALVVKKGRELTEFALDPADYQ